MTDHVQVEPLMVWASTIDLSSLQSEDDVETKIVLPFFKILGYPETHRRGKYPMDDYQPRRSGRKPEADQMYFSTAEQEKQNADTALLLIEAKNTQIHDLESAIVQAKYYGNLLKPPFLVITNGHRIIVLKRHQHHSEEITADITIDQLCDLVTANTIYKQLQFETVKKLKEQLLDPLRHVQYVELMQVLSRYPDIQEQLAKGDFKPSIVRDGRLLRVVKPKVAITCELPIAFVEGSCRINFSNIMLRGLACHLLHEEILRDFLIGLETPPDWNARPFLHKTKQNMFEAHLGGTTVTLSECEAYELCNAVDEVCKQYKGVMIETTNTLETWDFRPVKIEDEKGFEILSVESWLWEKMKQFSHEFDYDSGNSEWHVFDRQNLSIRVCPKNGPDHVVIWPKFGDGFFPSKEVDLLYIDCITYLHSYEDTIYDAIFQNVGPHGVWTASYTKEWVEQQFIPKVLSYYSINQLPPKCIGKKSIERIFLKIFPSSKLSQKRREAIVQKAVGDYSSTKDISLVDISDPKQFVSYLDDVQSLFHSYHVYGTYNVSTSLLRAYYAAFTELARCTDPATIDLHYIRGNLRAVSIRTERDEKNVINSRSNLSTYNDVLTFLDKQVARIHIIDYEDHKVADLLSRTFIAIIENGTLHFQQNQINVAKEALYPLWVQCRFNRHFIEPMLFPL